MVANDAAAIAAATKIQALTRGNRDRRTVEANLVEMIEGMMARTEMQKLAAAQSPKTRTAAPTSAPKTAAAAAAPSPQRIQPKPSYDSDDVVEEEIIVLIDEDSENENEKDGTVVEIVTYEAEIPTSPPPRPKTAFERYNEQLKKPVAFTGPKKHPAANRDEPMPTKETIDAPWRGRGRSRGLKTKPDKSDLDDISNHMSKASGELDDSHHGKNRIGIPWLRPTPGSSPEPSSREASPPPPPRPVSKNPLVNRYLSAAVKTDSSEYERKMAQIEADRSRGRWQGVGPDPSKTGGDESKPQQAKTWNWKQPKPPRPPPKKFDEGAAIKLQALARGFLTRCRVTKMVDALIEEMMRKKKEEEERRKFAEEEANRDSTENYFKNLRKKQVAEAQRIKEEKEALRKKEEEEEKERRRQEEEEAQRKEKEEEERRRKEEEALIRREWESYNNRKGLPLWWMERVPHDTLSQIQYTLRIKKDKVPTIIEYKPPAGWEKRFSKPLGPISEEDHGENLKDDNDANLDKILPDFPEAAPIAETAAKHAVEPEAAPEGSTGPKRTKAKRSGSFFSWPKTKQGKAKR